MSSLRGPRSRNDFKIAIICTLPVEAAAVEALFDEYHDQDGQSYSKAPGDTNSYVTGRMGQHHVILAFMPDMGKGAAAGVAASLRSSYPQVRLALVLGICGGVPTTPAGQEIVLGDIVISEGIVQYDFGRLYPDKFVRRDTVAHGRHMPSKEIRSFIAKLKSQVLRHRLDGRIAEHLSFILREPSISSFSAYPGAAEDKLFSSAYIHKHHSAGECGRCTSKGSHVCDRAQSSSCQELGCDERLLIPRQRWCREGKAAQHQHRPVVHFGLVASGDMLMRSGTERDRVASREKVIAFEMEGAGVWDILPCLLIKGVSDYADSHKNKKWQGYASATAAACLKAFLEQWTGDFQNSDRMGQGTNNQDSWVDGIWIGANTESSVVASTLKNEGGITLRRERKKDHLNKSGPVSRPEAPRKKPSGVNHRVHIDKNVTGSVIANKLTNTGGINL